MRMPCMWFMWRCQSLKTLLRNSNSLSWKLTSSTSILWFKDVPRRIDIACRSYAVSSHSNGRGSEAVGKFHSSSVQIFVSDNTSFFMFLVEEIKNSQIGPKFTTMIFLLIFSRPTRCAKSLARLSLHSQICSSFNVPHTHGQFGKQCCPNVQARGAWILRYTNSLVVMYQHWNQSQGNYPKKKKSDWNYFSPHYKSGGWALTRYCTLCTVLGPKWGVGAYSILGAYKVLYGTSIVFERKLSWKRRKTVICK